MMRVLIFLALVGAALAVPKQQQRIVGGSPTTINEYPYMANMQYGWFGIIWMQSCGGSLITTVSVLSAAHCYFGDAPFEWRVILGSSFASSGGNSHNVAQLINHQQYVPATIDNDVAIVRLATPAVLSATIATASIPGVNYNLAAGTPVTTIGWGTTSSGGTPAEQLRHVDITIIDHDLCTERYAFLKTQPGFANWPDVTPGMLCAGRLNVGGADACQGDSGGPLAHNGDVIVGVVSWGFGCADAFYPGVNARISAYSNWVVSNSQ